jgi:hypothetical protein
MREKTIKTDGRKLTLYALKHNNSIQFSSIYLHANLTAKGQLQSEHVKKYRNDTQ